MNRLKGILWIAGILLFLGYLLIPQIGNTAKFSLEDVSQMKYINLQTATQALINTGSTFLHAITINTPGNTGSTVQILDSLTATGASVCLVDASTRGTLVYDILLANGLYAKTSGSVTAPDVVISFR